MPDMTDDWMNPPTSVSWAQKPPINAMRYFIQRQRAITVSGNVSAIYQWDVWSEHDTAEERDAALERLRAEHPAWRLRAKQWNPAMPIYPGSN